MDNYYIIVLSCYFGEPAKKFTYNQFLKYAESHAGLQAWKVKKTEFNSVVKTLKSAFVKDVNGKALDYLRRANKAERI